MNTQFHPSEGSLREQLAAYFLAAAPRAEQTPAQRREYDENLARLGALERQDLLHSGAVARPQVWGNPAILLQALLSACQRLAAGLGQPLFLFPARDTAIGTDTLIQPRLLSIALCDLLCQACCAAPRQPVWVRLQEQQGGLTVVITATLSFATDHSLRLIKECTRQHDGHLVHSDHTILFSCGQAAEPPAGVHLYGCPTEQELLQDSLSPVWSVFYSGISSITSSSSSSDSSINSTLEKSMDSSDQASSSSSSSSTEATEGIP